MAVLDFYNQNAHRHYPMQLSNGYLFGGVLLPYTAILDAGFILNTEMDADNVKLVSINKSGNDLIFRFEAIGYSDVPFLFQVNKDSVNGKRTDIEISNGGMGYLVTGLLSSFYTSLGSTNNAGGIYLVEPAIIQRLKDTFISSFTIVSGQRSIYVPPDGCESSAGEEAEYYVTGSGIVGDVKFKAGYNANIRIVNAITIEIGAGIGYGSGKPCIELEASEGALTDSTQFDGPECVAVLTSINGIKPLNGNIDLISRLAGPVVSVDVENNKVIIDFTKGNDMALCLE